MSQEELATVSTLLQAFQEVNLYPTMQALCLIQKSENLLARHRLRLKRVRDLHKYRGNNASENSL